MELEDFSSSLSRKDKENTQILIATPENVMEAIEERLEAYGLSCHVRLTSRRWAELMSYHYICDTEFMPLSAFPIKRRVPYARVGDINSGWCCLV